MSDRRLSVAPFEPFLSPCLRELLLHPATEGMSLATTWAATFTDPRLCAAIIDRLTFKAHIIETDSYRLHTTRTARTGTPT